MGRITIRPLKRIEEFRQCERIQMDTWGTLGVASEVLKVTAKYGGAVIGAFEGAKLAGFIYAFLARRHGELIHWSHQMAVAPGSRDRGLGFRMKIVHRRLALAAGIRSICWTFDPLQSRNAALNIARLGARAEEYLVNCYGRFPSRIERGLPSDRFVVNWRIATRAVERRLKGLPRPAAPLSLPRVNETRANAQNLIANRAIRTGLKAPELLVEIPSHTDAMRASALPLARRWRMETRRIFEHYFARGYVVDGFITPSESGEGRCFYVLRQSRQRMS
jgi:predicted GNAT superfamily acetyltransferase